MRRLFIILGILGLVFLFTFSGDRGNVYKSLRGFERILAIIQTDYYQEPDADSLIKGAIDGMIDVLGDPHSNYLTAEEYNELKISTQGEFGGVGIQIGIREDKLTVISTLEGTPAERVNLLPGDYIAKVEGKSTKGWTTQQAAKNIRGTPGTDIVLTIERGDEIFDVTITREIIKINPVPYACLYDSDIGYVRLASFSRQAESKLETAVDSLFEAGAKKLIFDLRNNSGGLLDQGVGVAELFLSPGKLIVETKGRRSGDRKFLTRIPDRWGEYPLVVLVNEGAASASEIVAGAIQDWERGIILGARTFGKGSVQNVFPLEGGGALRLTTALWYIASGRCINKRKNDTLRPVFKTLGPRGRKIYGGGGITPDIIDTLPSMTKFEQSIYRKGLFFSFVNTYTKGHKDLKKNLVITPTILDSFKIFITNHDIKFTDAQFEEVKKMITYRLKIEFGGYLNGLRARYKYALPDDPQFNHALVLLEKAGSSKDLFDNLKTK